MNVIDLNCDLGESYGAFTIGMDEAVLPFISSANIGCGWHGGDPVVIEQTVSSAVVRGVAVGAHPSFPDLMGFGRREMMISPREAGAYIKYQVGAFSAFAKAAGVRVQHVKPHGAMYNMACKDQELANAICEAVKTIEPQAAILAPMGSALERGAAQNGLAFAGEFFADRAYQADGGLVNRRLPGAMITDPQQAARRVLDMLRTGQVECIDGQRLTISCLSVCVHGDNAHAVETVGILRRLLEENGITIKALGELIG